MLAGTGFVHLHPPADGVVPPGPDGRASAIIVAAVADVDVHCAHAAEHGALITYGPADMSYDVREYGARDHAGHHWRTCRVSREVQENPGFGRWVHCVDDQGVRFGLRQPPA